MKLIVNLSSFHTLHPISKSVNAFKELCDRYSPSWKITEFAKVIDKLACCNIFSIFGATAKLTEPALNWGWVIGKNISDQYFGEAIINSYKLGKINSKQFLQKLLDIFYFMKNEKIKYIQADIDRIWNQRDYLISLKSVDSKEKLTPEQIASALLEGAWNAMVDYTNQDEDKLKKLLSTCKSSEDEIYIISNTNELQVSKLLYLMHQHHREISWEKTIDVSCIKEDKSDKCVKIAPNMYLYLSYRVGAYKTATDNKEAKITTTPALLKSLIDQLKCKSSEILVVSQFSKDLEEARNIGVPVENTFNASNFYPSTARTRLKID